MRLSDTHGQVSEPGRLRPRNPRVEVRQVPLRSHRGVGPRRVGGLRHVP